jgi:hypothetical protein
VVAMAMAMTVVLGMGVEVSSSYLREGAVVKG